MKISQLITKRLKDSNRSFNANDNISEFINNNELDLLLDEITDSIQNTLRTLVIDIDNDHNCKETAKRIAKMYLFEIFKGRYEPRPKITEFPNFKNLDTIYTLDKITVRSTCSHHFVPITGHVWIGVIPNEKIIGISKFNRLTDWVMSRPQIQEESIMILADEINKVINPKGLIIYMKAEHHCMSLRGVKEHETCMNNIISTGVFLHNVNLQNQFFNMIGNK